MSRVFALVSAGLWVLFMLSPIACGDPDRHGLCQEQTCSGHGACAERDGSPICFCDPGFIAEGLACLLDPCAGMVCVHGSCDGGSCMCELGYAGALCDACADGYHSDLLTCQPDSPCHDLACVHGRCRLVDGQPICDCDSGYRGALCDACAEGFHPEGLVCIVDSPCDPDPCVHGACEAVEGEAHCDCEPPYAGERCDACAAGYVPSGLACIPLQGSVCDPNPCDQAHRSICEVIGDAYACACDPNYQDHDGDGTCLPARAASGVLIDYYVSAEDGQGNISRSPLMHVWVAE